jgi:hypothetical protein
MITEDFLHFVWQYQLVNYAELKTLKGESIQVIQAGTHNKNSGPDFSLAKIIIDNTTWAGNIEIHIKTSDWFKHKHQHNKKYENIILHIVYEHDVDDASLAKMNFPVAEIKKLIPVALSEKYKSIIQHKGKIPCEHLIGDIDTFRFKSGLNRLAFERLQIKSDKVFDLLKVNKDSWEETMYQLVARSFGLKINAETFEKLAQRLPLKIIGKHKNNLLQIEALLFGTAGLLHNDLNDDYGIALHKEFQFLKAKYNLQPLEKHEWHFLRLRPAAFPTIRLSQFAMLLFQNVHLFSKIKENMAYKNIQQFFKINVSTYWQQHYVFDTLSEKRNKSLGNSTVDLIMLNSIVPVMFAYGLYTDNETIKEKAVNLLESITAESNSIIKEWAALKYQAENALESQALLQLKNEYCNKKRCLNCHVGTFVLKRN